MKELSFYITLDSSEVIMDEDIILIREYLGGMFPKCKNIGHTVREVPDYNAILEMLRKFFPSYPYKE